MTFKVADLHCDLLSALAENNDPMNPSSNCSLPQLREGGVALQTLAIFVKTHPGSTREMEAQLSCYRTMLKSRSALCAPYTDFDPNSDRVHFILAIENASALLEEEEALERAFERLDAERWLYISLTWNDENRFGGGNNSKAGLKRDGEHLLEYISGNEIAIDLSHTSDALADGILNYIHKRGLKIVPIASHSNFRSIKDHCRNLSDVIAKEIVALGGVIGLNFVRHFIGDRPQDFIQHIEHAFALGARDQLCLGADFFGGIPLPELDHLRPFFQKEFSNSSCYPAFFELLEQSFTSEQLKKLSHQNLLAYLSSHRGSN
ncbi:MAG: hypothetical protein K1060chlam2_00710 [Chlamydiae bacterium]|nr:hypothetical protein [Chlamydiota bacterium]